MANDAPQATPADPSWHRYTPADTAAGGGRVVTFGADLPTEGDLKLLGQVEGRRVLDLGCGAGHNAVVLAGQGAKVIAVDPDAEALGAARERAEEAEVRVELHQAGLADLAFLRSDSIDAAISVMALATVDDLARVLRQVHRVLKPESPLVCSFPHPAFAMFDPTGSDPLRVARSYDQAEPCAWTFDGTQVVDHPRTVAQIFTTFQRSSFGIDQLHEPTTTRSGGASSTEVAATVPTTLILRARKQGN